MIQPSHLHALNTLLRAYLEAELELDFSQAIKLADLQLGVFQGNLIFHSFDPKSDINPVNFNSNIYFDIAIVGKFLSADYLGTWEKLHEVSQTLESRMRILKKLGLSGTVKGIEIYNAFKQVEELVPYKMTVDLTEDCYQASCLARFQTVYSGTDFQNLTELF